MLKLMGNETKTAHDGLEAIEAAAAYCPELILLRYWDASAQWVRHRQENSGATLGQTPHPGRPYGRGQDEDRRKLDDAGFDSLMVKPVEHAALMKLLASLKATSA